MRKLVLMMMTTLDGRLDRPEVWVKAIDDELESDFVRAYDAFDTVLVGKVAYGEMVGFWPKVETDENETASNRRLAQKLNACRKIVFSRTGDDTALTWHNAEWAVVRDDEEMVAYIHQLKAQPGSDIHLIGGAAIAQSMIRLGLVDEFRLFVQPIVSPGVTWVEPIADQREMELVSTTAYSNGAVGLHYRPLIAS